MQTGRRNLLATFVLSVLCYSDPLPKSVLVAFRARRNLMSSTHGTNLFSVVRQCDRAGRLLRESLKLNYSKDNTHIAQVSESSLN